MPRRPEQFEEIRGKSREKILSAALELFANKGYDSTSMDSLAKKAGISKGLIYNYYKSKKDILIAIFEDITNQGELMVHKHLGTGDPVVRLKNMIGEVFRMLEENPEYLKLVLVLSLQPGVMADTKDFTKKAFKRNEKWMEAIYTGQGIKDPIAWYMFDALIDGIMLNHMRYGSQYPIKALKERIIRDYCGPKKKKKH